MCIAIHKPKGARFIDRDTLHRCATSNPHGMGLMWVEDGEIKVYKTMYESESDFDRFFEKYRSVERAGHSLVMHFRLATHGQTDLENCHPFFIPNTNNRWAMCHNGIISDMPYDKEKSDTRIFADEILGNLKESWLESGVMCGVILRLLGGDRVILMNNEDEVFILNEKSGVKYEGSWFSNSGFRRWGSGGGYGCYSSSLGSWDNENRNSRRSLSLGSDRRRSHVEEVYDDTWGEGAYREAEESASTTSEPRRSTARTADIEEAVPLMYQYEGGTFCYECAVKYGQEIPGILQSGMSDKEAMFEFCDACGLNCDDDYVAYIVQEYGGGLTSLSDFELEHLDERQQKEVERLIELDKESRTEDDDSGDEAMAALAAQFAGGEIDPDTLH